MKAHSSRPTEARARRAWDLVFGAVLAVFVSCGPDNGLGQSTTPTRAAPPAATPVRKDFVQAGDVLLPASLGTVRERFEGTSRGPLVFVIGESHVDLEVQRTVAGILRYLRGAYDVKVICSEGMKGPLPLPPVGDSLLARRAAAEAQLLARHIDGVGYFALSYPDVRVVGVEDMEAYIEQGRTFEAKPPELEAWAQEFQDFVNQQAMDLSPDGVEQLQSAFNRLEKDGQDDRFAEALYHIWGRESEAGRSLSELLEKRQLLLTEAAQSFAALTRPDHPLMDRRDRAIVAGALSASEGSEPVAVVVGSLHLPGVAAKLKSAGRTYVTILAAGVPENLLSHEPSSEDARVYKDWQDQKLTLFEEWMSRRKPRSTLSRPTLGHEVSILGALWNADRMLRRDDSVDQVRAFVARANLPAGLEILQSYPVPSLPEGIGIDFQVNGKQGYILLSSQPSLQLTADQPGKIEYNMMGDRHYAIFDGGSGRKPPTLPPAASSPSGPGDFGRRFQAFFEERKQKRQGASWQDVTLAFFVVNGVLVRAVDDRRQSLGATRKEIIRLYQAYKAAKLGEERLALAQELAALLLPDIDRDLPEGRTILRQISERDMLGDLSLAHLAALAKEPGTNRLAGFQEVYMVPWETARTDLSPLDRTPAPVSTDGTVVWIADSLATKNEYASTLEALRAAGIRVNETLRPGDVLVLLGGGESNWRVTLQGGKIATSNSQTFQTAVRTASQIASFGFIVPKTLASQAEQISSHEVARDQVLSTGRELVEEIRKSQGKESLDRLVRRRARAERAKARDRLARKSELQRISSTLLAQWEIDSKASVVNSAT